MSKRKILAQLGTSDWSRFVLHTTSCCVTYSPLSVPALPLPFLRSPEGSWRPGGRDDGHLYSQDPGMLLLHSATSCLGYLRPRCHPIIGHLLLTHPEGRKRELDCIMVLMNHSSNLSLAHQCRSGRGLFDECVNNWAVRWYSYLMTHFCQVLLVLYVC